MSTSIVMPQLGESVAEGIIGKWLKGEGDSIQKDEPIVEVITDKVNAEIPSPVAGVLERITQPEGATVAVGDEIALIGSGDSRVAEPSRTDASDIPQHRAESGSASMVTDKGNPSSSTSPEYTRASPASSSATLVREESPDQGRERVRSSPLVRRLADQYGISLAEVPGTGIGGRVSKQDILSYVEQHQARPAAVEPASEPRSETGLLAPSLAVASSVNQPAPAPSSETTTPGEHPSPPDEPGAPRVPGSNEEMVPVSPLRKMIAARMAKSTTSIPHATTSMEVDMTNVVRYREANKVTFQQREGVPLSYAAFVVKCTVEALKEHPMVNAEWGGDYIIMKRDININVAVDAPEGLTTPVIHHADDRSLAGLSKGIHDLALRARGKKLTVADMQGGTFTVNNTGALGSVGSVSIINYPQAGILTANAIVKRPVVMQQDGQDLIAVRSMMNLAFSFDHRLLDGGAAAAFVNAVKAKLESFSMNYPLY
ncbi:MAG: dihydrolipoamide acetyltransferase family protein [Chloroflexota bacterium]